MTNRKPVPLIGEEKIVEPKIQYLAIIPTMCGLSVCGVTKVDCPCEPDLYEDKSDWYDEQADQIRTEADEVASMAREPCEVGTDEELKMVLVYEDGRIIDAADLVTDYRKLFDKEHNA